MKKVTTIAIDYNLYREFVKIVGTKQLSGFVNNMMRDYIQNMSLKQFIICGKCGRKTHLRVALNNGGKCQYEDCSVMLLEKINNVEYDNEA